MSIKNKIPQHFELIHKNTGILTFKNGLILKIFYSRQGFEKGIAFFRN